MRFGVMLFPVLALIGVSAPAFPQAAESQWYIGATAGSVGSPAMKRIESGLDSSCASTLGASCASRSDTSVAPNFGAMLGYQASKYLAAEIEYADLGDLNAFASSSRQNVSVAGDSQTLSYNTKLTASAISISALGFYPVGAGAIFAKLGAARWSWEEKGYVTTTYCPPLSACTSGTVANDGIRDKGVSLLLGAGYEYYFAPMSARLMFDSYRIGGAVDSRINRVSVAAIYRF